MTCRKGLRKQAWPQSSQACVWLCCFIAGVLLPACGNTPLTATPLSAPSPSPTLFKPTPLPLLPTLTPTRTPRPTSTAAPPTAPPLATPNPSATPDPFQHAGQVLFADDFETETGWGLGAEEAGVVGLGGGRLTITVTQMGMSLLSLWGGPVVRGAYYQLTASPSLCSGHDEYSLLFNLLDENNYHRFSLTCDGLTQAARVENGATIPLRDFAPTGSVIAGAPAENELGVWSAGGTLHFYVNGVYLYTARDKTFTGGVVGLYVRARSSETVSVSFDDLTVWAVNPTQ